jgi:hypothetical protein
MTMNFKRTPIAIAVAALLVSPLALASEDGNNGDHGKHHHEGTSVTLKKDISVSKHLEINGSIGVSGQIPVTSSAMAVIDDQQTGGDNNTTNTLNTNNTHMDGNALQNSSGNIGVNQATGANNMQDNAAAMAVSDAYFVFGSSDSEIFVKQQNGSNNTTNAGNSNTTRAADNALRGASGNIGVNMAAGSNNMQKNNLAMSTSPSRLSEATVSSHQSTGGNNTTNAGRLDHVYTKTRVTVSGTMSGSYSGNASGSTNSSSTGSYSGTSDQIGNVYPDIWANNSAPIGENGQHQMHPTDQGVIGHMDLDTQTQGGSDLNNDGGALAFNQSGSTSSSSSGRYSGSEAGDVALSGTLTGYVYRCDTIVTPNVNESHLGGNAMMGASGKIGVNMASGSNNLQNNSLSLAMSHGALGAPSTGGGSTGGE